MSEDRELNAAQERAELGWNRDTAIETIGRTLTLANRMSQEVETYLATWTYDRDTRVTETWELFTEMAKDWREYCREASREVGPGKYGTMRKYYSQANALLDVGKRLESLLGQNPQTLVKMTKELVTIVEKLMGLQKQVAGLSDERELGRQDELASYLTDEQLVTVLGWIRDNQEG